VFQFSGHSLSAENTIPDGATIGYVAWRDVFLVKLQIRFKTHFELGTRQSGNAVTWNFG
jgi:hypothetical protein